VPDHLKDAGRLKDAGDCKFWLPHPNNREQREASPDSVADEGGEDAERRAKWKATVKAAHEYGERNAKEAAGGSGARSGSNH